MPVYNVGAYLDVCMESLMAQTFQDMEILLINDGSTDDSPARCRSWAARDSRVRVTDRENGGVASARNLGVSLARGRYIAFVDPDDWLDPTYLDKLHSRLEETGADYAECDLWRYDNRTGRKIYRSCGSCMGQAYTLREHMKYGPTATYKSMSRRSLWERWQIRMPSCSFESPAVYALVIALSGRVESIPEALYYYRRFRENSLIETGYADREGRPDDRLGIDAMAYLVSEFRRCGLYETYKDTLEGVVKYRLNDILAMQFHRRREEDFRTLVRNCRDYLGEAFPQGHNEPYITWGGYNLNRVLTHMDWLHDPSCRFNFSSIAAVCGGEDTVLPAVRHRNRYRQEMLERERQQSFWRVLEDARPEWLFMDLMEERFDLLRIGTRYLTASDAREGRILAGDQEEPAGERLACGSQAWRAVWTRSAETFVRRIRERAPRLRPVIVESLLSERVGDLESREAYPEREAIRETNAVLRDFYRVLEDLWPEALVLRPSDDPLYFTDRKYEYGAVPSHLNELFNRKAAAQLLALTDKIKAGGQL